MEPVLERDMEVAGNSTHELVSIIAESAFSTRQMALLLGVVLVTAMLLVMNRRRVRESRNAPRSYVREQMSRLRNEEGVMKDMQEVMLQLQQLSRQINAQIDNRFQRIETVIRDADERIHRLDKLIRQADGQPAIDVTVDDTATDADSPPASKGDDPQQQSIYRLADAGQSPVEIAQEVGRSTGEIELILALRKQRPAGMQT